MNSNDFLDYLTTSTIGSLNMTPLTNIYYFGATESIAYTYNLPVITCDGMRFKIVRLDKTLVTATLTIVATNDIIYGGNTMTNLTLDNNSTITFISFNGNWYVSKLTAQGILVPRTLFSGNFTSNNGTSYQVFSGTRGTPLMFSMFTFLGTSGGGENINGGLFNFYHISGTPTVTITLRNSSGSTIIATSETSVSILSPLVIPFASVKQANLPTTGSLLSLYILVDGNNRNKVGLSGFVIY